jgi:hypothetical protein
MTLYVIVNGFEGNVELDLCQIVNDDNGNINDNGADPLLITYAQSESGTGQDRLNDVINGPYTPIWIQGVDGTFLFPNGEPITNGGGYNMDPGAAWNPTGGILIVYDTSGCNGENYWCIGSDGSHIYLPTWVLLYHELSHAYHKAIGDYNFADPEFQAITDENALREQYGLPLRDPNQHQGGCGIAATGTPCFIVSSVYGTSRAPQVLFLQRLRDKFLRDTVWGLELFEKLWAEYYQCSPHLVAEMEASPLVKRWYGKLGVDPLLDFLMIAEEYLTQRVLARDACARRAGEILVAFERSLRDFGVEGRNAQRLGETVTGLRDRIADGKRSGVTGVIVRSGTDDASLAAAWFGDTVLRTTPDTRYLVWAVFDPIVHYWSAVERLAGAAPASAGTQLIDWIDDWVGATPLPEAYGGIGSEEISTDLRRLAELVFRPTVRQRVGRRLAERFAGEVPYDFREVLSRAGFGNGSAEQDLGRGM